MEISDTLGARVVRAACIAGGVLCVGLAVVGMVLPLVPTTPFLLLAAALFFRGSRRMYHWLLSNRYFGHIIRDFRAGQGIPRRAKHAALLLLWLTIGVSLVFTAGAVWVQLLLLAIALGVTIYLARLPVRNRLTPEPARPGR